MLVVKVELHPFGDSNRAKTIETMKIWNDSVLPDDEGNYKYGFSVDNIAPFMNEDKTGLNTDTKEVKGELHGYDRKQNVWNLVKETLTEALKK